MDPFKCQEIDKNAIAARLSEGGWFISGYGVPTIPGTYPDDREKPVPVVGCEVKSGMLLIRYHDPKTPFELTHAVLTAIVEENQVSFEFAPFSIVVSMPGQPYMVDGGISMARIYYSLCKMEDMERHEREERERDSHEADARRGRLQKLAQERFIGKRIKNVKIRFNSVEIEFEDAESLEIEHVYGEDGDTHRLALNGIDLECCYFDEKSGKIQREHEDE